MLPLGLLPTDAQKMGEKRPVGGGFPQNRKSGNSPGDWFQSRLPFLAFLFQRLLSAAVTFLIITAAIYAMSLVVPAEERARLYLSERFRYQEMDAIRVYIDDIIERHGLDDPFPVQYGRWLGELFRGNWGYSATLGSDVLSAVAIRSPATLELTLYSILLYIPLGLLLGSLSASKRDQIADRSIRLASYIASAIPPFVLGFMLIAIVYVQLGLFDLSRIGIAEKTVINDPAFFSMTGLFTIDGLLNFRPDITWQAIRHLVLPVVTLASLHLATLILITRNSVIEELQKEYVLLAKGMGLRERKILFTYGLRNALLPSLTHSALTAAQLITGVYVVEAIFNWHGVSELLTDSMGSNIPDVQLALGFSVYSVVVVLSIVFILDLVQAMIDPRIRLGKG